jgi:DNA ligase-associated metallophosphoesterase
LLPEKAIYYKSEKALILSDIHLGKTGHFRNAGIPVPSELAYTDLETIDKLLNDNNLDIEKIIVLGDLSHAGLNFDWKVFEEWRMKNKNIHIHLIKGNHDKLSVSIYRELEIEISDAAVLNKFVLVHNHRDAENTVGMYKISGHIHPAVRIKGKARQGFTLPCFYFGESTGVLPAFGRFTGMHILRPNGNDVVFVIMDSGGEKKVLRV